MAKTWGYADLALMDWLHEEPGRIFTQSGMGPGDGITLWRLVPEEGSGLRRATVVAGGFSGPTDAEATALVRRLGGTLNRTVQRLHSEGYVLALSRMGRPTGYARLKATLADDPFHYADSLCVLTKAGSAWWESEGRALFASARDRHEAQAAEADRLVVVKRRCVVRPEPTEATRRAERLGIRIPDLGRKVDRPWATARVVRETAKRLYVEDIRPLQPDVDFGFGTDPVNGRRPSLWVDRDSMMLDDATPAGAARLAQADREFADDVARISSDALASVVEALVRQELRLKQKLGERDDAMSEILARLEVEAAARREGKPRGADTDADPDAPRGPGR